MSKIYLGNGLGIQRHDPTITEAFLTLIIVLVAIYVFIGLMSLTSVVVGEEISYVPFWHGPWRWLFKMLLV